MTAAPVCVLQVRVAVLQLAVASMVVGQWGCAASGPHSEATLSSLAIESQDRYRPNRFDYEQFRARVRGEFLDSGEDRILEPNYLPFVAHALPRSNGSARDLVLCRWSDEQMPLKVYILAPVIGDDLQKEFRPVAPAVYVAAVERALASWEEQLEELVRFQRVASEAEATLVFRIHGAMAPEPQAGFRGLGRTEAISAACRSLGDSGDRKTRAVRFELPGIDVYVADEVGLLTPHQVEGVTLHEIGHALGMMGHSPIPVDLMFNVPTDRIYGKGRDPSLREALSLEDVNTFVSLYRLPNGTVVVSDLDSPTVRAHDSAPPSQTPRLAMAPHVNAKEGFEVRVPEGWIRVDSEFGLYAANGPIWDHDASIEIFFWPHPTIEDYLSRFGAGLFRGTRSIYRAPVMVDGRNGMLLVVESAVEAVIKEFTFVELGDGRLMIILCEAPSETAAGWRPYFQASIDSLQIWLPHGLANRGRKTPLHHR